MGVKLKLIAAASENMGIGIKGDLPWKLKKEMAYFTRMTSTTTDEARKNIVIMGRRTWDCIPPKYKPFSGRINFILSKSDLKLEDYEDTFAFKSLEQAVEALEANSLKLNYEDVWVIGGSSIYKEALNSPHFYRLYLTKIHKKFDCDTFFPIMPENLKEVREPGVPQDIQEENSIQYSYHIYETARA